MEELSVLIEKSQAGDKETRSILIENNLGLVHHIVKRFAGRGYETEDLFQIGVIGLMKAIDKFDLSYDVKFSTYAVPMILGEIKRFLRDDGMIKVSRTIKENGLKVRVVSENLIKKLGREPRISEIAEESGLSEEEITVALEAGAEVESIYKSVYQNDGSEVYLVDKVAGRNGQSATTFVGGAGNIADTEKEALLNHLMLKQVLEALDEKEKKLIEMRYFQDKTQSEVAACMGISQVQVSRLEKKSCLRCGAFLIFCESVFFPLHRKTEVRYTIEKRTEGGYMKRKKKELLFYVITIASCLIAMTIVVIAALLIYDKIIEDKTAEKEQELAQQVAADPEVVSYSQEEVDMMLADAIATTESSTRQQVSSEILDSLQASLESGTTMVESLRPIYKDKIVVVSNKEYHFVPIDRSLKQSTLVQENLQVLENGELQYVENGEVVSHKGIDVSRYQGTIDWKKVADSGVEFAFVRVGVRGYGTEGKLTLDEKYKTNIEGASKAGIKVGVYFFSQAITEEEAKEEADLVIDAIDGLNVTYPIVYDVEKTGAKEGRMNQLTVEERTRMAHVFIDRIKEAGYTPMIYANMEMWSILINMSEFEDVDKWYAYYSPVVYFPYEYAIWQYSDTGTVPGITGDVDLNISFKEW